MPQASKPLIGVVVNIPEDSPQLSECLESLAQQTVRDIDVVLVTATAFERPGSIVFVAQEILQRAEEKSAKPSLLPIHAAQRILREQVNEEPLDKILRIRGVISAMAQKSIKWRPIRFA